jgi:hypothetical protein
MSHLYDRDILELAASRGFDHDAHLAALGNGSEDEIALTHPANWLTEFEVKVCTTLDTLEREGLVEHTT